MKRMTEKIDGTCSIDEFRAHLERRMREVNVEPNTALPYKFGETGKGRNRDRQKLAFFEYVQTFLPFNATRAEIRERIRRESTRPRNEIPASARLLGSFDNPNSQYLHKLVCEYEEFCERQALGMPHDVKADAYQFTYLFFDGRTEEICFLFKHSRAQQKAIIQKIVGQIK